MLSCAVQVKLCCPKPMLLPDSCLERADIDSADRNRLRPDIMLVEMSQSECMSYRRHSQRHLDLSTTRNSQSRPNAYRDLNGEKYG